MTRGPRYRVAFKRRRMRLTDYRMRKAAISSRIPRLVVRSSSKYIYAQLIEATVLGDKILAAACSKELNMFDWKFAYGNTPAAFLTGLLLGKRGLDAGIEEAILDIGLRKPSTGSKVFAVLKGTVDAGLHVPHDKGILPSEKRLNGEHISLYAKMVEEDQQLRSWTFSQCLRLRPEQLSDHFQHVKDKILNSIKSDGNNG